MKTRALGKRGVWWDGINLLVHNHGWSLRSHLEVTAVLHTPTSLGMLCDSFGGGVLNVQFKVGWLFAPNVRDDDQQVGSVQVPSLSLAHNPAASEFWSRDYSFHNRHQK
jgi:hypothetical protein